MIVKRKLYFDRFEPDYYDLDTFEPDFYEVEDFFYEEKKRNKKKERGKKAETGRLTKKQRIENLSPKNKEKFLKFREKLKSEENKKLLRKIRIEKANELRERKEFVNGIKNSIKKLKKPAIITGTGLAVAGTGAYLAKKHYDKKKDKKD